MGAVAAVEPLVDGAAAAAQPVTALRLSARTARRSSLPSRATLTRRIRAVPARLRAGPSNPARSDSRRRAPASSVRRQPRSRATRRRSRRLSRAAARRRSQPSGAAASRSAACARGCGRARRVSPWPPSAMPSLRRCVPERGPSRAGGARGSGHVRSGRGGDPRRCNIPRPGASPHPPATKPWR